MSAKPTFVTSADVARMLGLSVETVNRLARDGELPTAAKGPGLRGARLFDPIDVIGYQRRRAAS